MTTVWIINAILAAIVLFYAVIWPADIEGDH
jgi:hypothetical protein